MEDAGDAPRTALERRLVESVVRGEVLDLAGAGPVDGDAMRSWGRERTIPASVIRDIVRGRLADDPDPRGLRLRGARIAGRIDLENITSDLVLQLRDCAVPDGINLRDTALLKLDLSGSHFGEPGGGIDVPIDAARLTAREVRLNRVTAIADAVDGAVQLTDAHLGLLRCDRARLSNTAGHAIHADRLRVDQDVFLTDGFSATGSSDAGAVRLPGAHIGGVLACGGARLTNTVGPALDADNVRIGQDMFLNEGFTATSDSVLGTVRLIGAHVGGQLTFDGARLTNTAGPALIADSLHVEHDMFLSDGFTATTAATVSAVGLAGAHIGGVLTFGGARLANTAGAALDLQSVRVDQDLLLSDGFDATGAGRAVLRLAGARIGGIMWLDTVDLLRPAQHPGALVDLDGVTYSGLPRPDSPERWLTLLRRHTPAYAAQPYRHLAAAHHAAGHDRVARAILIAQRRDQLDRAGLARSERAWGGLTGLTLGYGYQPWRALLFVLAILATAVVLALVLGRHGGLTHTTRSAATGPDCSTVERIGVGLDLGTPLLRTGAREVCQPTDTTAGQALTVAGWLLQLLAWAFATLFIAGFTNAVRKT